MGEKTRARIERIDLYLPRPSWLHATDPRVKLLGVACALIVLFLAKNLIFMLAVLALVHLLYASARIPWRNTAAVWKTLLPIGALMALVWILFYPSGEPFFQFWILALTPVSVAQGLVLALRILNLGLVVTLWLYTTDSVSIVSSLVKLGAPFEWGLVLALALRYIPFIQESYVTISEAQQARGLNLSGGKGFARARAMLPIFIAMMISALRASEHIGRALESRGFGARGTRRTSLHELEATPRDYVLTVLMLLACGAFVWLNLTMGVAVHPLSLY